LIIYTASGWRFNKAAEAQPLNSRGEVNAANAPAFTPLIGDVVFFDGGVNAHSSWVAEWQGGPNPPALPKATLAVNTENGWVTLEPLLEPATTTLLGKVRLATQSQVDAGLDETTVVTPFTLRNYNPSAALNNNQSRPAKAFRYQLNLTANTWATINHNLNNNYPSITVYQGNEVILLDIETVDANNIRLRAAINLSNVTVSVVG